MGQKVAGSTSFLRLLLWLFHVGGSVDANPLAACWFLLSPSRWGAHMLRPGSCGSDCSSNIAPSSLSPQDHVRASLGVRLTHNLWIFWSTTDSEGPEPRPEASHHVSNHISMFSRWKFVSGGTGKFETTWSLFFKQADFIKNNFCFVFYKLHKFL